MQAFRAYYSEGRFVPIGLEQLPEGTQAIITVLDDVPCNVTERLREFDQLMEEIRAAADEEMPEIERVHFAQEVEG